MPPQAPARDQGMGNVDGAQCSDTQQILGTERFLAAMVVWRHRSRTKFVKNSIEPVQQGLCHMRCECAHTPKRLLCRDRRMYIIRMVCSVRLGTLPRILNGVAFAEGLRAELHCYRLKRTARLRRTAGLVWVYTREALAQRGSCWNDQSWCAVPRFSGGVHAQALP